MKERHSINICYSIDINECKEGQHGCHVNATCNNNEGSYNCSCKLGLIGDGRNSCKGKDKDRYYMAKGLQPGDRTC